MLIMEATVAVLIITGVLITIYSQQVDRRVDPIDYYDSVQDQILSDVSSSSELRLNVLNVVDEDSSDSNFVALNDFIGSKVPEGHGYHIRVCDFGELVCKMADWVFVATMDKDIYVEEIIVSAEVGDGTSPVYAPKRLKLFVWEGENVGEGCDDDECPHVGTIYYCSEDEKEVWERECVRNSDGCLIWNGDESLSEPCLDGETCVDGECEGCTSDCSNVGDIEKICDGNVVVEKKCEEVSECLKLVETSREDCAVRTDGKTLCVEGVCVESLGFFNLICERKIIAATGCTDDFEADDPCANYNGGGRDTGWCNCPWPITGGFLCDDAYECYNIETNVTGCLENPHCLSGWTDKKRNPCIPCTPNCDGKVCGDDGCGGNCPPGCGTDEDCVSGLCVGRMAELSATITISSIDRTDPEHPKYNYHLQIEDINNIGMVLKRGRDCLLARTPICDSWGVSDRVVPANGYYEGDSWWSPYNTNHDEYWVEYDDDFNDANGFILTTNRLIHPS